MVHSEYIYCVKCKKIGSLSIPKPTASFLVPSIDQKHELRSFPALSGEDISHKNLEIARVPVVRSGEPVLLMFGLLSANGTPFLCLLLLA